MKADTPRPVREFLAGSLKVQVYPTSGDLAIAASQEAGKFLATVLKAKGIATVMLAAGNAHIEFLRNFVRNSGVDWNRVVFFHMDEYLGIGLFHPASFRRYLKQRVERKVQALQFNFIEGDALYPINECERYARLLEGPIDLCCLGIGENGHLAFNDPLVADFADRLSVKIVKLDKNCRKQQVGEGHFRRIEDVPQYAITVTIPALCRAEKMVCVVPEARKAKAVHAALESPISTSCPASILRKKVGATLFLDQESSKLLTQA